MAWLKIESSVARNKKFVKAGPAPSWLWVCGLAYCQEGLTDGFIPSEALAYLGVKNARQLALHLVTAGLWDVEDGGWRVHDYLEHNKPASEIRRITQERREGGKLGGRGNLQDKPSAKPSGKPSAENKVNHTVNPSEAVAVAVAESEAVATATASAPLDRWLLEFTAKYPGQGRCANHLTETAFCNVLLGDARGPTVAYLELCQRLEGHIRSHQWRVKQMVPRLDRYLREGLHLQELPEHPVSVLVSDKTAGTMSAAAAVRARGAR